MFKDSFEPAGPRPAQSQKPQTAAEQAFWRLARANTELNRVAGELQTKGSFGPAPGGAANQVVYTFVFKGQKRNFSAQITTATNTVQIRNFLQTCANGVNGKFDQPDIRAYMPRVHRPF